MAGARHQCRRVSLFADVHVAEAECVRTIESTIERLIDSTDSRWQPIAVAAPRSLRLHGNPEYSVRHVFPVTPAHSELHPVRAGPVIHADAGLPVLDMVRSGCTLISQLWRRPRPCAEKSGPSRAGTLVAVSNTGLSTARSRARASAPSLSCGKGVVQRGSLSWHEIAPGCDVQLEVCCW